MPHVVQLLEQWNNSLYAEVTMQNSGKISNWKRLKVPESSDITNPCVKTMIIPLRTKENRKEDIFK